MIYRALKMIERLIERCYYLLLAVMLPICSYADDAAAAKKEKTQAIEAKEYREELVESLHQVVIAGKVIPYKATAGTLLLRDEDGDPHASIFYISYSSTDTAQQRERRPVTFCFNGGPGSSAVWLNLGTFGPRRLEVSKGENPSPSYTLIDNPYSLLDLTDLVFIDPISTGFSHAIPIQNAKQYHGVEGDIKAMAEFVRSYLTRFGRWSSPKFLAGESYGTTRAVALANYLHDKKYINMDGVILISSVLDFQSLDCDSDNDLAFLSFLPSYTAAAWYHQKLAPELQADFAATLEQVEDFVSNEYVTALFKGDQLPLETKKRLSDVIAYYTGLSPEYVERSQLRISNIRFATELLWEEKQTLGRFDSRIKGFNFDDIKDCMEYDPSFEMLIGPFTAAMNSYLREELKWNRDAEYKILANVHPWDYSTATNRYLKVSDSLTELLIKNNNLKVFVASGYYDLATPYYGTKYTFNHLGVDPPLKSRITLNYYEGGHMMYLYYPTLVQMKRDLGEFYQKRELQN